MYYSSRSNNLSIKLLALRAACGMPPHVPTSRWSKRLLKWVRNSCIAVYDASDRSVGSHLSVGDGNAPLCPFRGDILKKTRRKGKRGCRGRARLHKREAARRVDEDRAAMQRSRPLTTTQRKETSPSPPTTRKWGYIHGRTCPAGCRRPKSRGGSVRCSHNYKPVIEQYDRERPGVRPRPLDSTSYRTLRNVDHAVRAVAPFLPPSGRPRVGRPMPRGMPKGLSPFERMKWLAENAD